jgi:alpha,alpha-trehalase
MIRKTKNRIVRKLVPHKALASADVAEARNYIENFWVNLERFQPGDSESFIGLPNPYLIPAHNQEASYNFNEMYYWDSYFMIQGMLSDPKRKKLVMGILENLFALIKRYGVVPNASKTYLTGRSQPPLLTSFIFDVYEAYSLEPRWLEQAIGYAKIEYETVWMGTVKPFEHQVHHGLSRYYDINVLHDLAEAESGWDMTTRFNRRCLDYVPIDLNCYLYKYETDFARAAEILKQPKQQKIWKQKAESRKRAVNELMWSKIRSFYFDYDYKKGRKSPVASLAAYTALWSGLASKEQAKLLVSGLSRFEFPGGLATTEDAPLKQALPQKMPIQWAYPNGWAPLHFFVVKGLENYGYHDIANRIALKWLRNNLDWFNAHGEFLEKYNVVNPKKPPVEGVYPSQTGFGWTNAIFEKFCQDYIDNTGSEN